MKDSVGPAVVMAVDDEPENLKLLDAMLRQEGWDVRSFSRGDQALAAAREKPPALVLLDIRMPGMDGYETCRMFKSDAILRAIPIIFLSALSDTADKIHAFRAGGVDFVTKPFSKGEVLARVRTQIRLHQYQHHLESVVQERMAELAEAYRRLRIWDDAKNDWLNMLSHEMRTPITGVFAVTDLLFMALPPGSDYTAVRQTYDDSRKRVEKLMDDAGTIAQIDVASDGFVLQPVFVARSLRTTLEAFERQQPGVTARTAINVPDTATVSATPNLLYRAFTDLLFTAACCVDDGECISVEADCDDRNVRLVIVTDGRSLPDSALETFFEVGGQRALLKGGGDFGLGAALARRIIQLFRGNVSVRNRSPHGLLLEALLPRDVEP